MQKIKQFIKRTLLLKNLLIIPFVFFLVLFVPAGNSYAATLTGGNSTIDRAHLDGRTNFTIMDTNNPISDNGRVEKWSIYAKAATKVQLKIFRLVGPDHVVVGQSGLETPSSMGVNTFTLSSAIFVKAGDLVGLYFEDAGVAPFDVTGPFARGDLAGKVLFTNSGENPGVGDTAGFDDSSDRTYSVNVSGTVEYKVDDDLAECPEAAYTTIQAALAAAPAGETIQVCKGTYNGPINVTKWGMTIISTDGPAETIVEAGQAGNGVEYGFRLKKNNITVQGFTIQNADNTAGAVGVIIGANKVDPANPANLGNAATVTGNIFKHNNFSIYAWKSSNNQLKSNIIRNGQLIDGRGAAIAVWDGSTAAKTSATPHASNNQIYSNILENNETVGILIGGLPTTRSVNNSITNNVIRGSGAGQAQIGLVGIKRTTVASNVLQNSGGAGLKLDSADSNTIRFNTIQGPAGAGILLRRDVDPSGSDRNNILYNTITSVGTSGANDGIRLAKKANRNIIRSNTITGASRDGIRAVSSAKNNILSMNIIQASSSFDAHDLSSGIYPPGVGNKWQGNICFSSSPTGLCF